MDISEEISTISSLLDRIHHNSFSEEIRNWLERLASESTGFVLYLVSHINFVNQTPTINIKILYQLLELVPSLTLPQIAYSKAFLISLNSFFLTINVKSTHAHSIAMYLRLYEFNKGLMEMRQKVFINLLNFVEYIEEEEILSSALRVIQENLKNFIALSRNSRF